MWECIEENGYTIESISGQGSFGVVAKATSPEGETVAIKLIKDFSASHQNLKNTLREIFLLRKLSSIGKNGFTNRMLDIIYKDDKIFLVMEYCSLDLKKLIIKEKYSEEHIKILLYNILCCLNLLHWGGIVHRDIKPANILVNPDSTVNLCDFGMARVLSPETEEARTSDVTKSKRDLTPDVVTRIYRPPEIILLQKDYGTAVDIWCLGCVLAELIWGS